MIESVHIDVDKHVKAIYKVEFCFFNILWEIRRHLIVNIANFRLRITACLIQSTLQILLCLLQHLLRDVKQVKIER